jgi:carbon-monoxide dehydrogenase medium subunit
MKPLPFAYHAPTTIDEACEILGRDPDASKVLAGGQSLVPLLNLRLAQADHLIDLNRVDSLGDIRVEGDSVVIGAGATQAEVERSEEVRSRLPLLAAALGHVSHFQIRNRGTVVGSICHADPSAELPAVWLAVGGDLTARSATGTRTLNADEFFQSFLQTALDPAEIATDVRFNAPGGSTGWSFEEVARRHGDFALVGVVTHLSLDGGTIRNPRIVAFGASSVPVRLDAAEQLLTGKAVSDVDKSVLNQVATEVAGGVSPVDDVHATAEYRRQVAGVLAHRGVAKAIERATGT